MIHTVSILIVPDVAMNMHTENSLLAMRQLSDDLQQFAPDELLYARELSDFTEDERVFFNTMNQKHIAYAVSSKIAAVSIVVVSDNSKNRHNFEVTFNGCFIGRITQMIAYSM